MKNLLRFLSALFLVIFINSLVYIMLYVMGLKLLFIFTSYLFIIPLIVRSIPSVQYGLDNVPVIMSILLSLSLNLLLAYFLYMLMYPPSNKERSKNDKRQKIKVKQLEAEFGIKKKPHKS